MASCMLAEQPDDCSTCIEYSLTAPSRKQTASHLPSGLAARCSPLPGRQCVKVSWSLVLEWESSIMSCMHTALVLHHTLETRYNLRGTSQPRYTAHSAHSCKRCSRRRHRQRNMQSLVKLHSTGDTLCIKFTPSARQARR